MQSGMHHLIMQQASSILPLWAMQAGSTIDFEAFSSFHMAAGPSQNCIKTKSKPSSTQIGHLYGGNTAGNNSQNNLSDITTGTRANPRAVKSSRFENPSMNLLGDKNVEDGDLETLIEPFNTMNKSHNISVPDNQRLPNHDSAVQQAASKQNDSCPEETLDADNTNKSGSGGSGNTSGSVEPTKNRRSPRAGERRKKAKPVPSDDQ